MPESAPRTYPCMPWGSFSIAYRAGSSSRGEPGPTHENPGFELSWVGDGQVAFELGERGERVIAASAGASILLPPGLLNTPRPSRTCVQQILIAEDLFEEAAATLGSSASTPRGARVFGVDASASAIAKAIWSETGGAAPPVGGALDSSDPVLESLVHALTLSLVQRPARRRGERIVEPGIRRALDRIEAEYAEALRVDDLARTAGLSRFEFLRKFAAQVGDSPHRHLTAVRLERAAALLRTTRRSILAIALDCGFGDPSRFARAFAKRFGATPRAWRARSA